MASHRALVHHAIPAGAAMDSTAGLGWPPELLAGSASSRRVSRPCEVPNDASASCVSPTDVLTEKRKGGTHGVLGPVGHTRACRPDSLRWKGAKSGKSGGRVASARGATRVDERRVLMACRS